MNRLYFILIMCNVLAIGMLMGVWFANYRFDKGCEKDTNVVIGSDEYACIKMPKEVRNDFE